MEETGTLGTCGQWEHVDIGDMWTLGICGHWIHWDIGDIRTLETLGFRTMGTLGQWGN